MTAAASWEAAESELPLEISGLLSLSSELCLQNLQLLAAIPEWEVALPGGETTSNTDVMAFCSNQEGLAVVAVEAKVLESFGPYVGEKRKGASENQSVRLNYLHQLLKVEAFPDTIRYQLLHRTASAILTAQAFHAKTAIMLVHAFATPMDRRSDFQAFCKIMGAEEVAPSVYKVASIAKPQLFLAWCNGNEKYREVALESAL
jgi:hypothetical protein